MTKMKIKPLPTQEYLLDCFEHIGSHLIWLERPIEHFHTYAKGEAFNRKFAGEIAGTKTNKGYIRTGLKYTWYFNHRIIYKMHTGIEPDIIDHINRIRTDNRFENLRNGTETENMTNKSMYKNNRSGYKGIYETLTSWQVTSQINGKQVYVGAYPTLEEAIQAKKEWDEA